MYREVTMVEVKEVLRLWRAGLPTKRLAAQLGLDPKTVAAVSARRGHGGGPPGRRRRAVTDDEVRDTLLALQPLGGRPRGDGWAQCAAQREAIRGWLADGLRLTKIRKLLARQGVAIAYPTLYRFAVLELQFGQTATTIPVLDWRARPGAAGRYRAGSAGSRCRPGQPPSVSRVDLHRGPLAPSLRVSDLRGDDRARDRGVRSRVGLLRRRLHGPHPRQHQGDHRPAPIRSRRASRRRFSSMRRRGTFTSTRRASRGPETRGASSGPSPASATIASPAKCSSTLEDARARARTWCLDEYGLRRHSRTQRRPLEHFRAEELPVLLPAPTTPYDIPRVERAQGRARSARLGRPRRPTRFRIRYVGQVVTARADTQHRPLLRPRAADQDPSAPTAGRPADRSAAIIPSKRVSTPCATSPRCSSRPTRPAPVIGRFAAALLDSPVAVDAHAARVCAARPGPPLRRRRASPRSAPSRSPPTCSMCTACSACSSSASSRRRRRRRRATLPPRPLSPPRAPVRAAVSRARPSSKERNPQ